MGKEKDVIWSAECDRKIFLEKYFFFPGSDRFTGLVQFGNIDDGPVWKSYMVVVVEKNTQL